MGDAAPDPMLPTPYRVVSREAETHDTATLALAPSAGGPAISFQPGQFTMLYAFGLGEIPISISGDPADRGRLVHTIRGVGAVSRALASADEGEEIGVRGPFGAAWPLTAARGRDLVVVVGGIGLAPLRPVIYAALAHRADYGSVSVLVGARSEADLLFTREYDDWRARGADVLVTVDAASESWRGHVGVVTRLVDKARFRPEAAVAMICGPEIMMRYAVHALRDAGLSDDDVHVTMERNMKCAIALCGHCQYGPDFLCKDGPVLPLSRVATRLFSEEV